MPFPQFQSFTVSDRSSIDLACDVTGRAFGWGTLSVSLLTAPSRAMRIDWASANGIGLVRGYLPAMNMGGSPNGREDGSKVCLYRIDQPCTNSIGGRETVRLRANEFIVQRTGALCAWSVPKAFTYTSLIVERDLFQQYMSDCDELLNGRLSDRFHLNHLLGDLLESAWLLSKSGLFEAAVPRLLGSFAEILCLTSLSGHGDGSDAVPTALDIRRAQVKAYIEQHYASTDLSIPLIAKRLQLSPRYIQTAFAAVDQSPSGYLKQCRLQAAQSLLRDPTWRSRNITEILLACGFNSPAHFSNEFKRRFGTSPRDYRNVGVYGKRLLSLH